MDFFEAVARVVMKQQAIATHTELVAAMQKVAYARFAAIRTADRIFGKQEIAGN